MDRQTLAELKKAFEKEGHTNSILALLALYVAHKLDEETMILLSEHVQSCQACKNAVERLRIQRTDQQKIDRTARVQQRILDSLDRSRKLTVMTAE